LDGLEFRADAFDEVVQDGRGGACHGRGL
jgi:hypothetical protein